MKHAFRSLLVVATLLLLGATDGPFPFEVTASPPKYPRDARRNKVEGWVDVEVTVDQDGKVTGAEVITASPPEVFDQAAKDSVMTWHFAPKCSTRFPRMFKGRQTVTFKLTSDPAAAESDVYSVERTYYKGPEQQRIVEQPGGGFRIEAVDPCAPAPAPDKK